MISLQLSTPEDAAAVAECIDAVARERRFLAFSRGFTAEQTRSFIASLAEQGGTQVIAVEDGKVVGWCDVTPLSLDGMSHVGRLGMGLRQPYRGRGLGSRLVNETLSRVFASGLYRVELEVFASNQAAVKLYERSGFLLEGRKRCARVFDGEKDDVLIFGLLRDEWRGGSSP